MKAKISLITLGVSNMERSKKFYQELGFPLHEASQESIAFFNLEGTWLSLYPIEQLAEDAQVPHDGHGFQKFTLAHNVGSEAEVDATLESAVQAGASLVKPGQKVFWGGYSGYFKDYDDHLWEVAFNPFMDLT